MSEAKAKAPEVNLGPWTEADICDIRGRLPDVYTRRWLATVDALESALAASRRLEIPEPCAQVMEERDRLRTQLAEREAELAMLRDSYGPALTKLHECTRDLAASEAKVREAEVESDMAAKACDELVHSLGEYVRQSMHQNPEWAHGFHALEALSMAIKKRPAPATLPKCTLCDNASDLRWGLTVDGVYAPLCDGCAPSPVAMGGHSRVAAAIRAARPAPPGTETVTSLEKKETK